jgi:hypothetical protein
VTAQSHLAAAWRETETPDPSYVGNKDTESPTSAPHGGKLKPWEAVGMSRTSWYRHGRPDTKPECSNQRATAKAFGMSVRTIQRAAAAVRRGQRDALEQLLGETGFDGP